VTMVTGVDVCSFSVNCRGWYWECGLKRCGRVSGPEGVSGKRNQKGRAALLLVAALLSYVQNGVEEVTL